MRVEVVADSRLCADEVVVGEQPLRRGSEAVPVDLPRTGEVGGQEDGGVSSSRRLSDGTVGGDAGPAASRPGSGVLLEPPITTARLAQGGVAQGRSGATEGETCARLDVFAVPFD